MARGLIKGSPKALAAGKKAAITRAKHQAKLLGITVNKIADKNYDGMGKSEFRRKLVDTMYQHGVAWGNVVSLETSQWRFNNSIPAHHIHYQCDPYEYKQMRKTKPYDTEIILGDIRDLIKLKLPIDGLWLDYMRTYDKLEEDISLIMSSKPMKYCTVVGLTISPRSPSKGKERQLQADRILTSMNKIFDGYERQPIFPYKDGAPMWGIIFVNKRKQKLNEEADQVFARIVREGEGLFSHHSVDDLAGRYYDIEDVIYYWGKDIFLPDYRIPDRGKNVDWNKTIAHRYNTINEIARVSSFLNSFIFPKNIKDSYNIGTSKAGFRRFVSKFKNKLVIPVGNNLDSECMEGFILKPNLDILKEFGWGVFGEITDVI